MIRKSYIIHRDNFFNIALDERVSKVEIANSYNKTLRDKSLCKIYVYYKLTMDEWMSITNMLKQCQINAKEFELKEYSSFLTGVSSAISYGFLPEKHYNKILEISELFPQYRFHIPRRLFNRVLKTQLF